MSEMGMRQVIYTGTALLVASALAACGSSLEEETTPVAPPEPPGRVDVFLEEGASWTTELPSGSCAAALLRRPPRTDAWSGTILSQSGEPLLEWEGGVDMAIQVCGPSVEGAFERVLVVRMRRGSGRVFGTLRASDEPIDLESHSPNPRYVERRRQLPVEVTTRLASSGFSLRDVRQVAPVDARVEIPLRVEGTECASVYVDDTAGADADTASSPDEIDSLGDPVTESRGDSHVAVAGTEVVVRGEHTQVFAAPAFFQWCSNAGEDRRLEVRAPSGATVYLWTGPAEVVGGQGGLWRPLL